MIDSPIFVPSPLFATTSWLSDFGDSLRNTLGPSIKAMHEPIDIWLGSLPMSVAMACTIGLYVAAGIWIWTLKKEFVFRGAPSRKWWYDLRLWATVILLPYIAVYVLLG